MAAALKLLTFRASNDDGESEPTDQDPRSKGPYPSRRKISLFDLIPAELLARSNAIRHWGINE
jgi:hypothetical protein